MSPSFLGQRLDVGPRWVQKIGGFPKIGLPQNGCFKILVKWMIWVPLFEETSMCLMVANVFMRNPEDEPHHFLTENEQHWAPLISTKVAEVWGHSGPAWTGKSWMNPFASTTRLNWLLKVVSSSRGENGAGSAIGFATKVPLCWLPHVLWLVCPFDWSYDYHMIICFLSLFCIDLFLFGFFGSPHCDRCLYFAVVAMDKNPGTRSSQSHQNSC